MMCDINIFDFATKELTQDAIVAYILNCLNSNAESNRKTARLFVNEFICDVNDDTSVELSFVNTQYSKIDVYAELYINGELYSIIIENKTNTFLHSNQMKRYCENIAKRKKDNENLKVIYILFKSSNIYPWQMKQFDCEKDDVLSEIPQWKKRYRILNSMGYSFKIYDIFQMEHFILKLNDDNNQILSMFKSYVCKLASHYRLCENWDEWKDNDKYEEALNSHSGQVVFWGKAGFYHPHMESNSGDWSSYAFFQSTLGYNYLFRYGWKAGKKCIFFQQHSFFVNELDQKKKDEEFELVLNRIKGRKLNVDLDIQYKSKLSGRAGEEGRRIFEIVFSEENTPEKVAEFIKVFVPAFKQISGIEGYYRTDE